MFSVCLFIEGWVPLGPVHGLVTSPVQGVHSPGPVEGVTRQDMGYPHRQNTSTTSRQARDPPPTHTHSDRTRCRYPAGGTPLAVTQEDCLVYFQICLLKLL